jgi:hypothetical protein
MRGELGTCCDWSRTTQRSFFRHALRVLVHAEVKHRPFASLAEFEVVTDASEPAEGNP